MEQMPDGEAFMQLGVISFFLFGNSEEVSQRYLDNGVVKRFKEAENYQKVYRRMNESKNAKKKFRSHQKTT